MLPAWAEEMRSVFRAATTSQFILHGAIHDLVLVDAEGKVRAQSLGRFLDDVLFARFDVVVHYDRGTGVVVARGLEEFLRFLKGYDTWNGTAYSRSPAAIPHDPVIALTVLDRFLDHCAQNGVVEGAQFVRKPIRAAVIVGYAEFIAPGGDTLQVSGRHGDALIRLLDWGSDPSLVEGHCATVLLTENLADLHPALASNPYAAKVELRLPGEQELLQALNWLIAEDPAIKPLLDLPPEVVAQRLVGLSRVNLKHAVLEGVRNGRRIDAAFLVQKRRELIEKECRGLLDFIESTLTLDALAGCVEAKGWLRDDGRLIKRGLVRSLPMGYLLCGRIGTGKTFLTTCWAGEIGIPCVVLKNFRDKWQGSTEGNLEKIFAILRALGQVMVFIDEADQATGRRDSGAEDGGVAGRVYAMLAKEMSDTRNRGRIIWVFATSRPDLVEVDLKRPGRLDVHIPLFPPEGESERQELFKGLAKKVGVSPSQLPKLPKSSELSGNEMEGLLVRALRAFDLQEGAAEQQPMEVIIRELFKEVRPMAHRDKLELMDLLAVKECTDARFLPTRFRKLSLEEVDRRIDELKLRLREP